MGFSPWLRLLAPALLHCATGQVLSLPPLSFSASLSSSLGFWLSAAAGRPWGGQQCCSQYLTGDESWLLGARLGHPQAPLQPLPFPGPPGTQSQTWGCSWDLGRKVPCPPSWRIPAPCRVGFTSIYSLFQGRRMVRWTGTLTHWTCPSELRLPKVSGLRQSSAQAYPGSEALCYQAGLKGLGDPQKAVQSLGTCCGFRIRVSSMGHFRQGWRQKHREARHLQGHTACKRLEGIE